MLATDNDTKVSTNTTPRPMPVYLTEPETPRPRKPIPIKSWLWKAFTFPFLAIVYVSLIAEGLKRFAPELGQPLWRVIPLPGVAHMRYYEGIHRLALCHVMAFIILFFSYFLTIAALRALFFPRELEHRSGLAFGTHKNFIVGLASVVLICDASFFYYSLLNSGIWGGNSLLSFTALLMTVAYLAILTGSAYIALTLED